MAALDKYTPAQIIYKLRHNAREHPKPPSNRDIDPSKSSDNYYLHPPDRGTTARDSMEYYKHRMTDVYVYNRADVKTACEWVVTAPKDLAKEDERAFFEESYNYLCHLYGEQNVIQAIVHYDEGVKDKSGKIIAGRPHLHYVFIPIVDNPKYMKPNKNGNITKASMYKEKVNSAKLTNKNLLRQFHPNFQRWIDNSHISCTVYSGVTGGKNRSVQDLKLETKEIELEKTKDHIYQAELKLESKEHELAKSKERIVELEEKVISLERENERTWGDNAGWGSSSSWGKDKSWEIDL